MTPQIASNQPSRSGSLLLFFLLTYAIAWICFGAAAFVSGDMGLSMPALSGLRWPFLIIGAFAPSGVALYLSARAEGKAGAHALLRRLFLWRVRPRWYLFALAYMAAIKIAVALLFRVTMGTWPRFGDYPAWYLVIIGSIVSGILGGPLGEELGWRGYALPRMATRFGLVRASVLLGVIWAFWHVPAFFISGIDKYGQSLPLYVVQVTALSVAFAWLSLNTKGSLLLAVLLHTAINQSKDIVPSITEGARNIFTLNVSVVGRLTVTLLWICAAYFLFRMKNQRLME